MCHGLHMWSELVVLEDGAVRCIECKAHLAYPIHMSATSKETMVSVVLAALQVYIDCSGLIWCKELAGNV